MSPVIVISRALPIAGLRSTVACSSCKGRSRPLGASCSVEIVSRLFSDGGTYRSAEFAAAEVPREAMVRRASRLTRFAHRVRGEGIWPGGSAGAGSIVSRMGEENVVAEGALEDLTVENDNETIGSDAENLERGQRVVYLEAWQMKKMAAAADLGVRFVNVEALATEVGLPRSDVLAWLEETPSEMAILNNRVGSYMEDVDIFEEEEKPAKYVPPPPVPEGDVNMRNRVEDLMYALKDIIPGVLVGAGSDEKKWNATMMLFSETVEFQDPVYCLRGRPRLLEWVQLLGRSGAVINLHDIYYEHIPTNQSIRWVYSTWTATLTNDLQKSLVQLGMTDWWAMHHGPICSNSNKQRDPSAAHDCDDGLNLEENCSTKLALNKRVLQLSGESRFEMDESGQVQDSPFPPLSSIA